MKLVTGVIKPHKLEDVKVALEAYGVRGMTIVEASGHGRQMGKTEVYRGTEYTVDVLPKTRIELVCEDIDAEDIARVVASAARTGKIGDGKVWVTDVAWVMRIRTGETGEEAV